ncbi:MAG: alpha-glucan family phosphorylase [Candidatus Woesearchaeota archaeon]
MKHLLEKQHEKDIRSIAYFSMEIGIDENIPTYSGGLGILAGDTIKTFADLIVPVVAISIICNKGYFKQEIQNGYQIEKPVDWYPIKFMKLMPQRVSVNIEGREVKVAAWEYKVVGIKGFEVPIYFLDTNLEENAPEDREITAHLYGGDLRYRIKQEIILGIAGTRMLEALGYKKIKKYHMNEGHSAFLTLELLKRTEKKQETDIFKKYDFMEVKKKCVFTTHTPVPAGHDQFDKNDVLHILGKDFMDEQILNMYFYNDKLNMTLLALNNSEYINGVALRHREVSKTMFPGYPIDSITNGVNSYVWTCDEFKELFDKHIPAWRYDPFNLRYALSISRKEIWEAHLSAKKKLIDYVNSITHADLDYNTFTIGFARRSTPYKRLDLFFSNLNELIDIHDNVGKFQVIIGGKAHPRDNAGKELIRKLFEIIERLKDKIKVVYLVDYDMRLAKLLVSGVDLWLNTPRRPLEASGTSGMKAAHNGIPSFSVLDGWWIEGHVENITGWSIGPKWHENNIKDDYATDNQDAKEMYLKLREIIIPMFYNDWDKWTEIMRHAIAFNASFFNTHRMVHQYVLNSYFH